MSKKANPAAIGLFVIGAIALGAFAVAVFGSGNFYRDTDEFLLYFDDSVNNLKIGAPVTFKGVEIGSVTDIRLNYNQPSHSEAIPVFIEIDKDRMAELGVDFINLADPDQLRTQIRFGLRAKLQFQSYVTGLLYIDLDYYEDAPVMLVQEGKKYPEIPTVGSNLSAVWKTVTDTLTDLGQVDFKGLASSWKRLADTAEKGIAQVDFEEINQELEQTLTSMRELVESEQTQEILVSLQEALDAHKQLAGNLDNQATVVGEQLINTAKEFESAAATLSNSVGERSELRMELTDTLTELQETARAIRLLAEYLERNPNALITGKPEDQ